MPNNQSKIKSIKTCATKYLTRAHCQELRGFFQRVGKRKRKRKEKTKKRRWERKYYISCNIVTEIKTTIWSVEWENLIFKFDIMLPNCGFCCKDIFKCLSAQVAELDIEIGSEVVPLKEVLEDLIGINLSVSSTADCDKFYQHLIYFRSMATRSSVRNASNHSAASTSSSEALARIWCCRLRSSKSWLKQRVISWTRRARR